MSDNCAFVIVAIFGILVVAGEVAFVIDGVKKIEMAKIICAQERNKC